MPLTSLLATLVSLFVLLNTRFARYVWPTAIAGLCPEAPARATPLAWCYAPCCMVATLPSLLRRLVRSLRSLTNLGRGYAPPKGYALSVPSALLREWSRSDCSLACSGNKLPTLRPGTVATLQMGLRPM